MQQTSVRYGAIIDGEFAEPAGEGLDAVFNPAVSEPIVEASDVSDAQIKQALEAARRSFDDGRWRGLAVSERSSILRSIAESIRDATEDLAALETTNVGKPIEQSRDDVVGVADGFEYFANVIVDRPGEVLEEPDAYTIVTREPVGVAAAIVPWNYPLAIAGINVSTALAAGCSVALKPSQLTPLSAVALGELANEHLPPGVLNILPGRGSSVGEALVTSDQVDVVVFTGSVETGRRVSSLAGAHNKPVCLELGGKSPVIILDDAPLDEAVPHALKRITLNQGENCGAGSRLLIQKGIFDDVKERLINLAKTVRVGDPLDPSTELGPMISESHRAKVLSYVDGERADGDLMFRGETPQGQPFSEGFFAPLVITRAGPGTRVWTEEIFGPVLAVHVFDSDADAVQLANDTEYGLQATVWSGDRGRATAVGREILAGVVRVNASVPPAHAPWGGFKNSGLGRIQGRYGLYELTRVKSLTIPT